MRGSNCHRLSRHRGITAGTTDMISKDIHKPSSLFPQGIACISTGQTPDTATDFGTYPQNPQPY